MRSSPLLLCAGVTPKAVQDLIHVSELLYVGHSHGDEDEEDKDMADMATGPKRKELDAAQDEEQEESIAQPSSTEALADQQVRGTRLQVRWEACWAGCCREGWTLDVCVCVCV
jgi:hypothetical protein